MKKLVAIFAVLLFVAPAFAADWAFYGSERIATWYTQIDNGSSNNLVGGQVNGQGNDAATQWYFQGNARFGARVKADNINGRIEMRLANEGKDASSSGDTNVGTRLAWGEWKFKDGMSLKVGKMDSTATDIISNQWYDGDNDLLGYGNWWGGRPAGLELNIGGFALGMFTPYVGGNVNAYTGTALQINGVGATANGEGDAYFPKLEARYKLDLGAGYIFPFAGFQYYKVASSGTGIITDQLDVYSYVAGISTMWNIGAFSIGAQASYGMNEKNANWTPAKTAASRTAYLAPGGDDIRKVFTTQAELISALKFTDTLRFELGLSYYVDNAVNAPGFSQKDDGWNIYLQAMITMAPGVNLCPEVGYYGYLNDRTGNDEGYQWYVGAKWQIDF